MALDARKFLEEMKFSAEDIEAMLPKFTKERLEALEARTGDAASLTAAKAELKRQQEELAASNTRLNEEMAEWAALTADEKKHATTLQESLRATQRENFELVQKVEELALAANVDPKTVLPKKEPVVPKKDETPAFDASKFVPRDQFGQLMNFAVDLSPQLMDISDEHHELTGKRLDRKGLLAEFKKRAAKDGSVTLQGVWEELNNIPAIRTQKADEKRTAELKEAETRGYERARTEAALPSPSVPGKHSIVFRTGMKGDQPRTSVLKRPQPEAGVRSAAAALASGKYRQKSA